MFGHDSQPTRNYHYGCLPPVENLDAVCEQMYQAHRYRNGLCEIELRRRQETDDVLRRHVPRLLELDQQLAQADERIEQLAARLKQLRAAARKRVESKPLSDELKAARAARKPLYAERKELRKACFGEMVDGRRVGGNQSALADLEEVNQRAYDAAKALRNATTQVYWPTKGIVDQACGSFRSGAPPRFMRWSHDGKLAVQLQGGLSVADLLAGADTRLQLHRQPPAGIGPPAMTLRFRIGTSENNTPIWATVPIILHRELPAEAMVKWCYLLKRRVATKDKWSVIFVLAQSAWHKADAAPSGRVGIDLGWRLRPDGLRVQNRRRFAAVRRAAQHS